MAGLANPFESVIRAVAREVPGLHVTPQALVPGVGHPTCSTNGWASSSSVTPSASMPSASTCSATASATTPSPFAGWS